jgi:thiol-disulfide isomerase/thioredoxin
MTAAGELIGFLPSARREQIAGGVRVDVNARVPPGEYRLRCRANSQHAGYDIPFTVKPGQKDLDLGTRTIEPAGTVALKGKPAPALNVKWRSGEHTDWETLRGKVVILDFWGTWCIPCITDMPDLMAIQNRFKDKPVAWISIHTPEPKSFEAIDEKLAKIQDNELNKRTLPFTQAIDQPASETDETGNTGQQYGVTQWPTLIIVDQQGNVVGAVSKQKLAETISRLLESKN